MKKALPLFLFFALGYLTNILLQRYYQTMTPPLIKKAVAVIHPTKDNKAHGTVTFTQVESGIHIVAQLENLTPGKHGFHIHEFGDCSCPDATCACDHFNPTNQPHGGPMDEKRHEGDMGNIEADKDGKATYDRIDTVIKLNAPDSIIGRSIIIHEKE